MADIKPGDEVRVFDVNGKRAGEPEGGWPGEVIKVARTLATIRYRRGLDEQFRLDTQFWNDKRWGTGRWFRTLAQVEEGKRRRAAEIALREIGLEFRSGSHAQALTLEQLEALAAVVETFGQEAEG